MHVDVQELIEGLKSGNRGALARSITLLESRKESDSASRRRLLEACEELTQRQAEPTRRVAFTGAPGVGKSSLINRVGVQLIASGHQVAVLAIDPSSGKTGGSILGDKTRMVDLARDERAFIRPSPTAGHLGGIAEATREAILVCEAAGYDRIIVETVGVGQSEHQVSSLVDLVVFLTIAGAGDGLQGIKRGILESADLVAVNKADGEARQSSEDHARELSGALKLLRGHESAPEVLLTSATTGHGVDSLSDALNTCIAELEGNGTFDARRRQQRLQWFDDATMSILLRQLQSREDWSEMKNTLLQEVKSGQRTPYAAAAEWVHRVLESEA